jgi:hypothetical protein
MTINAGDRVRIETGQEGEIVILNDARTSAFVQLDEHQHGVRLILCNLDDLVKVEKED